MTLQEACSILTGWYRSKVNPRRMYVDETRAIDFLVEETWQLYQLRKKVKKDEMRILKNHINLMPKAYRKRNCNWVIVQTLLMRGTSTAGSTSSIQKCVDLGIDPDGFSLTNKN